MSVIEGSAAGAAGCELTGEETGAGVLITGAALEAEVSGMVGVLVAIVFSFVVLWSCGA
jgi:hypothetical protein